jgi:hypothetical protein
VTRHGDAAAFAMALYVQPATARSSTGVSQGSVSSKPFRPHVIREQSGGPLQLSFPEFLDVKPLVESIIHPVAVTHPGDC